MRYRPPDDLGRGYEDGFELEDDVLLTVKQLRLRSAQYVHEPGGGRLVFLVHLQGRRTISLLGRRPLSLSAPCLLAYYQGTESSRQLSWPADNAYAGVSVGFDSDTPPACVRDPVRRLLDPLKETFLPGDAFVWSDLAMTTPIVGAANGLLNSTMSADLAGPYVHTKARELMLLGLDSLLKQKEGHATSRRGLADRIDEVRGYIDRCTGAQPSLEGLAADLDLSVARLRSDFQNVFGLSFQDYQIRWRMQKAALLLSSSDDVIKRIAYEVGYGHLSNFSIAFKRHFGITPIAWRAQSRGEDQVVPSPLQMNS